MPSPAARTITAAGRLALTPRCSSAWFLCTGSSGWTAGERDHRTGSPPLLDTAARRSRAGFCCAVRADVARTAFRPWTATVRHEHGARVAGQMAGTRPSVHAPDSRRIPPGQHGCSQPAQGARPAPACGRRASTRPHRGRHIGCHFLPGQRHSADWHRYLTYQSCYPQTQHTASVSGRITATSREFDILPARSPVNWHASRVWPPERGRDNFRETGPPRGNVPEKHSASVYGQGQRR